MNFKLYNNHFAEFHRSESITFFPDSHLALQWTNLDYPYYEEIMGGGTPCDLMSGEPRVTRIMFICDREAPLIGMVSVCNAA